MEPEGLLLCSQEPPSQPYSEPDKSRFIFASTQIPNMCLFQGHPFYLHMPHPLCLLYNKAIGLSAKHDSYFVTNQQLHVPVFSNYWFVARFVF